MDIKGKNLFSQYLHFILNHLHESYFERLYKSALSKVWDEQAANDIVNDSFLALSAEIAETLNPSSFVDLLFSYTEGKCQTFLKNIDRTIEYDFNKTEITDIEWDNILQRAVADLPPQRKQVIEYVFMDGLTTEEIAIKMGLARQTVLNHKTKALHWLKTVLISRAYIFNEATAGTNGSDGLVKRY